MVIGNHRMSAASFLVVGTVLLLSGIPMTRRISNLPDLLGTSASLNVRPMSKNPFTELQALISKL